MKVLLCSSVLLKFALWKSYCLIISDKWLKTLWPQACQISETKDKPSLTLDYILKTCYHSPATANKTVFFKYLSDLNFTQHMLSPSVLQERRKGIFQMLWFSSYWTERKSPLIYFLGSGLKSWLCKIHENTAVGLKEVSLYEYTIQNWGWGKRQQAALQYNWAWSSLKK